MYKRKMDKLGIETTLLGFGCMRLPEKNGRADMAKTEEMIDLAYHSGVNYYDTAYVYHGGRSEVALGSALKKYPRESFYVADKMPVWQVGSQGDLERYFSESLRRLNMDYIDFYLLHSLRAGSWRSVKKLDMIGFCEKQKAQGRLRHIGFSFHDTPEVFEEILNAYDWDFCQIQLNYLDWENQRAGEMYKMAEEKGVPVVIMEPVRGGSLADPPDNVKKLFKEAAPDRSAASWALRYAGSLPQVKVVLSGMSTKEQVSDNLSTFDGFRPLTQQEYGVISRAQEIMLGSRQIGCTSCCYCMPCPAGVDIPGNFSVYNDYVKSVTPVTVKKRAASLAGGFASSCIECGECLTKCPQHIEIPSQLKKVGEMVKSM